MEPEDDAGNTEYKFKMCDLTMYKVKKRTTQMAYRLTVSSCQQPRFDANLLLSLAITGGQR